MEITTQKPEETTGLEVAVVGLAARFAGAGSADEFWRNLRAGVESISRYSDEEVIAAGTDRSLLSAPNFVKAGGVMDGVELFDASFFGYSPREAEIIDPQQRVFLECAWEALEHAGYDAESYSGLIGVYAGGGMSSYLLNIFSNPEFAATADPLQLANGNDKDHLTSRVAYKLNLQGPAVTVQSACSTSLVAVHSACQGLLSGACDMALAGGVSISLPQRGGYLYQEGGILSADGHCRAFDAAATGTVGGSGVGIVVLKRLEDALADGDTIHAVIKGSAVNNDGSLKVGYTAPSVEGQARVIRAAQLMAEVEPDTISYVETHGTGTALGDPIEIAALTRAFRAGTRKKGFCAVGSVKTNIGHADAAAGVAGLIKTVLALKHREIPPSLHFARPNPQIDFADSPFFVNAVLSEWKTGGAPRRAGVSSFGMGGTNAHVVLEEAPPATGSGEARSSHLLVLSAKTETALEAMTANLAVALRRDPDVNLADVAYTLQTGRRAHGHRRFLVCESAAEAADALERRDPKRVVTRADRPGAGPVVFMFPGQGSQHVNMGLGLYREEPVFREQVDLCSDILRPHLRLDLQDVLYPNGQRAAEAAQQLAQTAITQPALFTVEYALGKLWQRWGIGPQAMIGHSVGEYVAACLAGIFSLEDALMLIAGRGRLMQSLPAGKMLAIRLGEDEVRELLQDGPLSLAAINGTSQCVVSGPPRAVDELAELLTVREVSHRLLPTSYAFHSAMMEPILDSFINLFGGVKLSAPTIPLLSNLTGDWITGDEATSPGYWAKHLRCAVRFSDGLRELFKQPSGILLEVGPGETLSTLARREAERPAGLRLLHSLSHPDKALSDVATMLNSLGQLWLATESLVDWAGLHASHRRRRLPLPSYPFERRRFWVERRPLGEAVAHQTAPHKKQDIADWFYVPVWKQSAPPRPAAHNPGEEEVAEWLLFSDDRGVGAALAARLRSEGGNVVIVEPGRLFARQGEDEYSIDPSRREDYESLLSELEAQGRYPRRIVSLWGIGHEADNQAEAYEASPDLLDRVFYSLLFLAQALGERQILRALDQAEASPRDLRIYAVLSCMQKILDGETVVPEKALILGACRVIHQEFPGITCQSIDVAPAPCAVDTGLLINQLVAEVKGAGRDIITAFRGRQRWVQEFDQVHLPARVETPARLRERGVYLITGGLGGIALEVAQYLARTVRAKLILAGRSVFPVREQWDSWLAGHGEGDETSRRIRRILALEEEGAEVLILRADVCDREQMEAALAAAAERFGPEIHGVFHLAGARPDSLIQRKTREMAAAVLAPKVTGTRVLQQVFEGKQLDFLMLFSSLRTHTGGAGTFDYTAANAFLGAFAARYHSPAGTAVMAIDWDGWPEVGMSLGARVAAGGRADEEGLTAAEGVDALSRLFDCDLPQLAISVCDLQAVIEREQSFDATEALSEMEKARAAQDQYSRPRMGTPYAAPHTWAEKTLAAIWEELLGIDRVGINDNFFELGGDSVISIRIIARAKQAGLNLTPKQVFEHQTIAELAAASGVANAAVSEQGPVTGAVPLTPIQHWFFEQAPADPHHHNQALMLEVRRPLDPQRMEAAVSALILHHDALRLRLRPTDHGWAQFNEAPDSSAPFCRVTLELGTGAGLAAAIEAAAARWQASLNFTDGPLLRVVWLDFGETRPGWLLLVIHHLAVDAISWRVLLEDLESAYAQLGRGEAIRLPAKTTSFKEWAERLEEYGRAGTARAGADYWLAGSRSEVSSLQTDHRAGENTVASASTVTVSLDEAETRALLQEVPRVFGTQINDVLLAALTLAFTGWSGEERLLVDLEGHGREPLFDGVDLSRTVGWFTTIYPVLLDLTGTRDPRDALKAVHEQLHPVRRGGLDYGVLRYLSADSEISDRLRALPRAEVCFLYLGQQETTTRDDAPFVRARESCGPVISPRARRSHLFEVISSVSDGRLSVSWDFSRNLHRAETVEALAQSFAAALRSLVVAAQTATEQEVVPPPSSEFGWEQDEMRDILTEISKSTGAV